MFDILTTWRDKRFGRRRTYFPRRFPQPHGVRHARHPNLARMTTKSLSRWIFYLMVAMLNSSINVRAESFSSAERGSCAHGTKLLNAR
ncbi:hypothetical protein PoB_006506900 [Plakobranchus ocellatus]|uniref:Uncharacterized protein n=1 Tax=Plakobranchus ocellatus TaxID=259542 RepID=A0AAV4D341_9GAST|nr:hypothetical protein PoB_006506900 [Plakobranchus ocellatus]